MNRKPKAAIIGGGIGGLAAALALHRRGYEFDVYEQGSEITEIGGGLNLSPNALTALRMLGVEDASIEIGFQDEWQRIHSWHMKLALRNRFGTDKTPLRAQWVYD